MDFQGLDFNGDRPSQIREVRKEMAKLYDEEKIFSVAEFQYSGCFEFKLSIFQGFRQRHAFSLKVTVGRKEGEKSSS